MRGRSLCALVEDLRVTLGVEVETFGEVGEVGESVGVDALVAEEAKPNADLLAMLMSTCPCQGEILAMVPVSAPRRLSEAAPGRLHYWGPGFGASQRTPSSDHADISLISAFRAASRPPNHLRGMRQMPSGFSTAAERLNCEFEITKHFASRMTA